MAPVEGDAANPWRGTWISRGSWVSVFEFGFRLSSWIKAGSPTRHFQINDLHFLKKNSLFKKKITRIFFYGTWCSL